MPRTPNPPTVTVKRLSDGRIRADVRGGRPGAAQTVARSIASTARANAPRRTGELRGGITVESTGTRSAVARSDAPHSRYVDEGTKNMRPRRFFTKAVQAARRSR